MSNNFTLASATFDTTTKKFGTAALSGGTGLSPSFINLNSNFTVECWVKQSNPNGIQVVLGFNSTPIPGFWMGMDGNNAACNTNATSPVVSISSVNVCDGAWHHVALNVLASGAFSLYVDGVFAISGTGTPQSQTVPLALNYLGYPGNYAFTGEVDEIAVWNTAKYTSNFTPPTSAYAGTESGLLALWHLDSNGNDTAVGPASIATSSVSGTVFGGTSTVSGSFSSGAPTGLSYIIDSGSSVTATSPTITTTGGSGATAYGTWSFSLPTPAVGLHGIVVSGTGTYAATAPSYAFTITATPGASILPNNSAIVYSPYNWSVTSGAAQTINAGAYFRTLFSGATCVLNFNVANNSAPISEIWARIDDGPLTQYSAASTISLTIPTALSGNSDVPYHLLTVIVKSTSETINRWNSPSNTAIVFTGLTLDTSAVVLAPLTAPRNILIYGDSITEGVRTLGESEAADVDRNDAEQCYSYRLGALLGAEVGVVGFGASGLITGGSGNVPALTASYNMLYAGQSRTFSPVPDVIILNEGTNDGSGGTATAVTTVLNGLLAACSTSVIVVLRPFNGNQASNLQAGIAACSAPSRVHYVDTTGFFNTAYGADSTSLHPSGPNGSALIAPRIAAVVSPILGTTAVRRWTHS